MLGGLFPEDVATAWGDPLLPSTPLFPEEAALVAAAVPKRQLEFAKGRECARKALRALGLADAPLLAAASREPLWPAPAVGSITHTRGFCAAAVARAERYRGIGIDAEPAEPLERAIAARVCRAGEAETFEGTLERAVVPRLVFCAKEAVYKCVFPIVRRYLGFHDVNVVLTDGAFRACLLTEAPPFPIGTTLFGRWRLVTGSEPVSPEAAHVVASAWLSHEKRLP